MSDEWRSVDARAYSDGSLLLRAKRSTSTAHLSIAVSGDGVSCAVLDPVEVNDAFTSLGHSIMATKEEESGGTGSPSHTPAHAAHQPRDAVPGAVTTHVRNVRKRYAGVVLDAVAIGDSLAPRLPVGTAGLDAVSTLSVARKSNGNANGNSVAGVAGVAFCSPAHVAQARFPRHGAVKQSSGGDDLAVIEGDAGGSPCTATLTRRGEVVTVRYMARRPALDRRGSSDRGACAKRWYDPVTRWIATRCPAEVDLVWAPVVAALFAAAGLDAPAWAHGDGKNNDGDQQRAGFSGWHDDHGSQPQHDRDHRGPHLWVILPDYEDAGCSGEPPSPRAPPQLVQRSMAYAALAVEQGTGAGPAPHGAVATWTRGSTERDRGQVIAMATGAPGLPGDGPSAIAVATDDILTDPSSDANGLKRCLARLDSAGTTVTVWGANLVMPMPTAAGLAPAVVPYDTPAEHARPPHACRTYPCDAVPPRLHWIVPGSHGHDIRVADVTARLSAMYASMGMSSRSFPMPVNHTSFAREMDPTNTGGGSPQSPSRRFPVWSSEVQVCSDVPGVARFTAYKDGRVHARFADRTIVSTDAGRTHARFVLSTGETVRLDLSQPVPHDVSAHVEHLDTFSAWAFASPGTRAALEERSIATAEQVAATMSRIEAALGGGGGGGPSDADDNDDRYRSRHADTTKENNNNQAALGESTMSGWLGEKTFASIDDTHHQFGATPANATRPGHHNSNTTPQSHLYESGINATRVARSIDDVLRDNEALLKQAAATLGSGSRR